MIQDVLSVQDDWCQWHECDDSTSLRAENEAINRVLCHWYNFKNMYYLCKKKNFTPNHITLTIIHITKEYIK